MSAFAQLSDCLHEEIGGLVKETFLDTEMPWKLNKIFMDL